LKSVKLFDAFATLLILSGLLLGCAVERKFDVAGSTNDAEITASVQALINQHSDVGSLDTVHIQTLEYAVYLSGEVSQGLMRQTAEDPARQAPGVTRVVNNISVTK
jgi:osmotically-inducible protein OsmY